MNPALRDDPSALRVNVTIPTTSVRLGPFQFDGLQALVGVPLADLLSPLLRDRVFQRAVSTGGVVDVYPLAIPDGEGLSFPVKLLGEVGFRNMKGLLVLVVPPAAAEMVRERLGEEIAARWAAGPRFVTGAGGGIVAEFALRLRPGMRKAVPIGTLGEFGVEAA
jgi:hypothetical protein